MKLHDRPLKKESNSSLQMHQLVLYLSPGEIPYVEEVYMYNLLDFVGNVGGFLGLLLGASLISLFDQAMTTLSNWQRFFWLK